MQHNYHTMTNNAVLPTDGSDEIIHYHTKVRRDMKPRLAPTMRQNQAPETAQIHDGHVSHPVNDSPSGSPQRAISP